MPSAHARGLVDGVEKLYLKVISNSKRFLYT